MNYEDFLVRKIDKGQNRHQREVMKTPGFDNAYARAHEIFQNPNFSIQAPHFADLYGEDNVRADMARVKNKLDKIRASESAESKEMKRVAEVFEAITLDQANSNGWLGDGVQVLKTSLYDDLFNGTDMLAEWDAPESESQVLALSVDVTFSTLKMEEKVRHIRENVEDGNLGTVKYFKNKDGSFRGERKAIPRVVIGVDRSSVFKLANLWIKGDGATLKGHPAQRVILDEIEQQLGIIKNFAAARGQQSIADSYGRSLAIIKRIAKQKDSIPFGDFAGDAVYQGILKETRKAFGNLTQK